MGDAPMEVAEDSYSSTDGSEADGLEPDSPFDAALDALRPESMRSLLRAAARRNTNWESIIINRARMEMGERQRTHNFMAYVSETICDLNEARASDMVWHRHVFQPIGCRLQEIAATVKPYSSYQTKMNALDATSRIVEMLYQHSRDHEFRYGDIPSWAYFEVDAAEYLDRIFWDFEEGERERLAWSNAGAWMGRMDMLVRMPNALGVTKGPVWESLLQIRRQLRMIRGEPEYDEEDGLEPGDVNWRNGNSE